jgi:NAD(P)-dependent dehydrogenase (short-subunit alcohol dehydrogenase family)
MASPMPAVDAVTSAVLPTSCKSIRDSPVRHFVAGIVPAMTANKWTEADVPDQSGRVAIITGSNTGLGYETANVLAARGAQVVLAVRDTDKGKAAAAKIIGLSPRADIKVQPLDLGSLQSVRTAAEEIKAAYPRIDLLINNAGVMGTPNWATKDGFDLQFGINYLGHFALTGLLLDRVLAAPDSRIVTVSSAAHRLKARIQFDNLQGERSYNSLGAYALSKLANLLFAYELQRRLADSSTTISVAAHPGGSKTELARNSSAPVRAFNALLLQSAAMGALPTLRAATDPQVLGGQYFGPSGFLEARGYPKLVRSSAQSHDRDIQRRLWTISEELTGVAYPI